MGPPWHGFCRADGLRRERFERSRTLPDQAHQLIADETPRLLGLWPEWCAQNSGSANLPGLDAMADLVAAEMAHLGSVDRIDPDPVEDIGLDGIARARPTGKLLRLRSQEDAPTRVLLTGHIDTVFPPDHAFQAPIPGDPSQLHAPGAADMKGGLLVLLLGTRAALESPGGENLSIDILLNADEETGSLGSARHLAEAAEEALVGFAFEPALDPSGTMARARKGSGNFTVIAEGRAAHAGRNPEEGRNAVVALSRLLVEAAALTGTRPGLSVTPAIASGGTALNQVPESAAARINIRAERPEDSQIAEARLRALADSVSRESGVQLTVYGGFHRPPKPRSPGLDALIVALSETAEALGQSLSWRDTGGVCDGNTLAATGLPTIDTMGVRGAHIHTAEEFAVLDSLAERALLLARFLDRIGQGAVTLPPREAQP